MKLSTSTDLLKRPGLMLLRLTVLVTAPLLVCWSRWGCEATSRALGEVTVHPDPLSLEMGVGDTGTVDIRVENVNALYGVDLEVSFDPTVVEVVDADPGEEGVQIAGGGFLSPDWPLDNSVNNAEGVIRYAVCQLNPSPPQSGAGTLASITVRARKEGTSPIRMVNVMLAAPQGVPISVGTEDGVIVSTVGESVPLNTPALAPPATGTPTPFLTCTAPPNTPESPESGPTATFGPPTATRELAGYGATVAPTTAPTPGKSSAAVPSDPPEASDIPVPTQQSVSEAAETSVPTGTVAQPTDIPGPTTSGNSTPRPTRQTTPSHVSQPSHSDSFLVSSRILGYVALGCLVLGVGAVAFALAVWGRE